MFDESAILKDTGAVTSSGYGTVDEEAKILNVGTGLVEGNLVIDIAAVKVGASKDQVYDLLLMGGNDESFTVEVPLAGKTIGHNQAAAIEGNVDAREGRLIIPFSNEYQGTIYPYLRTRHVIAGTGSSINYQARLEQRGPVTGISSNPQTAVTTTTA